MQTTIKRADDATCRLKACKTAARGSECEENVRGYGPKQLTGKDG